MQKVREPVDVHPYTGKGDRSIDAQSLATDGVKIGQFDEVVVWDVGAVATLGFNYLRAELLLHVWMRCK